MNENLYLKYRPTSLEEMYGNRNIIPILKSMVKNDKVPHAMLFHGPSGCGKTTLARIVATELGCAAVSLSEYDSAQFRGIDTVRDIRRECGYAPLKGDIRVYILDECFAKGTQITMSDSSVKNIEDIKVGDSVLNLAGTGIVKNTFINKVDLSRLVEVKVDGKSIYCSSDHLFMTTNGWCKAKDLNGEFVFSNIFSNFVQDINLQKNEKVKKTQPNSSNRRKLLQKMQMLLKFSTLLSKPTGEVQQKILQQSLCGNEEQYFKCRKSKNRRSKEGVIRKENFVFENQTRENTKKEKFITNEAKQSFSQCENNKEGDSYEKNEWNFAYLEREKRWERDFYATSNTIGNSFAMGDGSCCENRTQPKRQNRNCDQLQSRYWESSVDDWDRGRWEGTWIERRKVEGLEEKESIRKCRVESVTFYERGNNDEYFQSIVTDKERNQGFINLYDFEVNSHHSYFANNTLVHNCHKMTNDAQNGLLKILEDTPPHVYFLLCTTDPNKLIAAIKTRCSQMQVNPLSDDEMKELLRYVVKAEDDKLAKEVYEQIIKDSLGSPRQALQILNQVLQVEDEERLEAAKQTAEKESQSIELARALFAKKKWSDIAVILRQLKEQDIEGTRRVVAGYATTILLSKNEPLAGLILEYFISPFYDTGFPQLVHACYSVSVGSNS